MTFGDLEGNYITRRIKKKRFGCPKKTWGSFLRLAVTSSTKSSILCRSVEIITTMSSYMTVVLRLEIEHLSVLVSKNRNKHKNTEEQHKVVQCIHNRCARRPYLRKISPRRLENGNKRINITGVRSSNNPSSGLCQINILHAASFFFLFLHKI